jgi:hypothetical protein
MSADRRAGIAEESRSDDRGSRTLRRHALAGSEPCESGSVRTLTVAIFAREYHVLDHVRASVSAGHDVLDRRSPVVDTELCAAPYAPEAVALDDLAQQLLASRSALSATTRTC